MLISILYYFNLNCYISYKYKTFSVLIYSYINTSGNWENEKLCGNDECFQSFPNLHYRFSIFTQVFWD